VKRIFEKFIASCAALVLGFGISGCVANYPLPVRGDENVFARSAQSDVFPGDFPYFSMGPFQKKENFDNLARVQWSSKPRSLGFFWDDVRPSLDAIGNIGSLQGYSGFDVRWLLKDGREFILENIDVRGICNAYLRKNPIQLQWQREGRPKYSSGDGHAILTFEVKDDGVLLKWAIRINRTPVGQRFTATGAATKWDFHTEEYVMAAIKGKPTSGIDFNKTYEPPPKN